MSSFRKQAAELWQLCATLTRKDIFGEDDDLRPKYKCSAINWEADVTAVGMVGKNYEPRGLVILSVNPAGGKCDYRPRPDAERMYRRLKRLRNSQNALDDFEKVNRAFAKDFSNWRITNHHYSKILKATKKAINDIAFVHVVPFRTRCDKGSTMSRRFLDNGYDNHLFRQLDLLAPKHIIAMDRPSERAAIRFKEESGSKIAVNYYNRGYHASDARKKTLKKIKRAYSSRGGGKL